MAFTIQTSVGSSMAAATGRSTQGHLCYAATMGAYWINYLSSTASLSALYSTNSGASWSAPGGSPLSLGSAHNSEGRNFGFCYGNLSSTDVQHGYWVLANQYIYDQRFTLGTTWTNTNNNSYEGDSEALVAPTMAFNSSAIPFTAIVGSGGDNYATYGCNVDSGSSWTYTTPSFDEVGAESAGAISSTALFTLASGNMLCVVDNNSASGSFTNLNYATGTNSGWNSTSSVFSSSVTQTDANAWGGVARTSSDVHIVALSNNSNSYVHYRWNGSSWSTGNTIGTLTYGTDSGLSLVSDGTSVWMAAIDSSKNVQYNQWTSSGGWGGWTVLEASRSNTPAYITGCYSSALTQIMWAWTESTGSNYNLIGSTLSTAAATSYLSPYNRWSTLRPLDRRPSGALISRLYG